LAFTGFELEDLDAWDKELIRDSQEGGKLKSLLERVRADIAAGRVMSLDEFLDNF
jgi:hypothetical protein